MKVLVMIKIITIINYNDYYNRMDDNSMSINKDANIMIILTINIVIIIIDKVYINDNKKSVIMTFSLNLLLDNKIKSAHRTCLIQSQYPLL